MSPEEQRLRTSQTIWTEGAKALVLVLVMVASTVVRSGRLKGGAVKAVEWIAVVAVSILVPLAFQKRLAAYERRTQDEALTKRAQALAVGQGVTIGVVRIDEGLAGRQHILAIRTKGVIVVTRRAADTLSPEEMDFLIARTLVSASSPSGLLYSLFLMASCVPFLVAAFWCFRHPEAFRWGVRYLPILLVAQFGVMYALRPLRERNLHAIDRRALKLTMKAEAAVSAIRKITAPAASAGAPVAAPRTTARLRALLASAHDLGLPISELDTAGTFTSASQA